MVGDAWANVGKAQIMTMCAIENGLVNHDTCNTTTGKDRIKLLQYYILKGAAGGGKKSTNAWHML